ncbi:twin-arginine translocase subunit TatB [Martelella lutilitoris]|uniref:Sec-independent protein translocase protein TatB n=1 Tax=Martelella lutilitoris TaxID=2583532 RepID=A0A5C4JMR5_9HYPH|nr:twin-arginine translocase subunit TatB [Martelella lutilitoris]
MLDIGWTELLVVAIVLVVVVGPRELPHVLRTFGKTMTKMRRMATDFRSQMDDALKEADMEDVSSAIRDVRKLNPANQLRDAVSPLRQTARDIQSDLKTSTSLENKPKATTSDKPDLPKASYPTPGAQPAFTPENVFQKAVRKEEEQAAELVSKRQDDGLMSRRPGYRGTARPTKTSKGRSGGRRNGR